MVVASFSGRSGAKRMGLGLEVRLECRFFQGTFPSKLKLFSNCKPDLLYPYLPPVESFALKPRHHPSAVASTVSWLSLTRDLPNPNGYFTVHLMRLEPSWLARGGWS